MKYLPLVFLLLPGWAVAADPTPESRALEFLSREVPRWSAENKCFSCHNNGDGARALYTAVRLSLAVPRAALADTTAWLVKPQGWDKNGGDGPFSDKKLARVQFAATLVTALESGLVKDRAALKQAAELVAAYQEKDGSWQVEAPGTLGSPATHGAALATYFARRTLREADLDRYREALARADSWLRQLAVKSSLDAATVLLALENATDAAAERQKRHSLELIEKGQSRNGGWGPFVTAPPEVFDTSLVLLALARQQRTAAVAARIEQGRKYLIAQQERDGSWPETTRPPGAESYAQRLSTAGWALQALLATRSSK